ncbi:MAG: DUF262 domain-containing protein [Bryobacteraceae bacterium]
MKTTATNRKLRQLLTAIKNGTLVPRPEFQRRLVWANKHKVAFLQTVLEQYPFPEIYLAAGDVNPDTGEGSEMLVDGQQRITTLYQYFTGSAELRLPKDVLAYSERSNEEKLSFLEYEVVVRDLGKMSLTEIKEVFRRINSTNYALNAMEISNARYEGALKAFAEAIAGHSFFDKHNIFSAMELRRMHDLRFVLTVIVSMMSGYFNRDDELEEYLKTYNDEFDESNGLEHRLEAVFNFIDNCDIPKDSRAWKRSDLLTLLVETDRQLHAFKKNLPIPVARHNLMGFYDLVDRINEINEPNPLLAQYYRASLQATNDRLNRIRRGDILRFVLTEKETRDWKAWSKDGSAETVEKMIEWFFKHYKDPADGVPYDSGEGGYQYVLGGPYNARDVLQEEFENVPDLLIEDAIKKINSSGWDWVKIDDY